MAEDDILFERVGGVGLVTLNRPQALNALTLAMARALDERLTAWAEDRGVRLVLVRGAGERAFSAGGDIRALYESGRTPGDPLAREFYRDEYRLNRRIKRYPKPYVAVISGVVMGGGVGVSVHGSHRVATERTTFAMPETGIGFFPDVGGSYFLPRCPGRIGWYLALTGARLGAADCLYAGIANHYVPLARLAELDRVLAHPGVAGDAFAELDAVLAEFGVDPGPAPLAAHREVIDRCFAGASVEAIEESLARDEGAFARQALAAMAEKSPTSQKVAHRALTLGAGMSFEECMVMEYRLSQAAMARGDFYEGVRAQVIDKDRKPRWRPESLAEVSASELKAWFTPLGDKDLVFEAG
ncbi:MAG: enoyl-CoA hydratase/isomerase family protein [Alphaproteobacteria bacterium]